jgi:dTDP-4-amino-4,6-dideoxygalactose transaminase
LRKVQEDIGPGLLMSDMNAALGLTQLHELPKFLERREELYDFYLRASLKGHHKSLHQVVEGRPPLFSYAILPEKGIKEIIAYVKKYNVETSMAFEKSSMEKVEQLSTLCPNAYSISLRCMLLPFYPSLSSSVVNTILKVLSTLP